MVAFYKCTTNARAPGAIHIIDTICAGLYGETYVSPKIGKVGINRLTHRYGVLSKFDRVALTNFQGGRP